MAKNKSTGKNKAIKSGNPAFKPTSNGTKKAITGKGNSLSTQMWRGAKKGK